jgi:electron-transferring-flavoprotein dehydrogenase
MTDAAIERESMEYDVIIVGGGPAGLSAAIRLKQRALEAGKEISIALLEKGAEIGAHILSGAVIDPKALEELFPDWRERGAPLNDPVTSDVFEVLGPAGSISLPTFVFPPLMSNHGCYIASLGNISRWLGEQAEALGVEIYPGFPAAEVIEEDGVIKGVVTGDFGLARDGGHKDGYQPGMELRGKYTLVGEGVRGSLAKTLIERFDLSKDRQPQKFGIGLKEIWRVKPENHKPGQVKHTMGWPLDGATGGGSFMYHFDDNLVAIGFVVHLNYKNPYISPFEEFQRLKTHPAVKALFEGAERLSYGARAITEGGYQSVPKLTFPGGALIGCSAGFVNVPRIKGSHNAMKTGMLAADATCDAILAERSGDELSEYQTGYEASWVATDLKRVRNVKPLWSKFGTVLGVVLGGFDMWCTTLLGGFSMFGTMKHDKTDAKSLQPAAKFAPIDYPKPDGVLTFDRLSSVFISNTNHEEDQPVHLKLSDQDLQKASELGEFAGPSTRYCPAGVYEWIEDETNGETRFQINAQNCVHCKTCDIKDPNQNINWTTPEGGGGPMYTNM